MVPLPPSSPPNHIHALLQRLLGHLRAHTCRCNLVARGCRGRRGCRGVSGLCTGRPGPRRGTRNDSAFHVHDLRIAESIREEYFQRVRRCTCGRHLARAAPRWTNQWTNEEKKTPPQLQNAPRPPSSFARIRSIQPCAGWDTVCTVELNSMQSRPFELYVGGQIPGNL